MPKIVDHDQRRWEIAQALWQVIYARGIDGVSFRAVAEAAGVSIGRVQHYFSSKDELVVFGCRSMVSAAERDHGPDLVLRGATRVQDALVDFLCAPLAVTEALRVGASVWATYQAKAVSHPGIAEVVAEAMRGRTEATSALLAVACGAAEADSAPSRPRAEGGPAASAGFHATALVLVSLAEGLNTRVLAGAVRAREAGELIRDAVDRAVQAA